MAWQAVHAAGQYPVAWIKHWSHLSIYRGRRPGMVQGMTWLTVTSHDDAIGVTSPSDSEWKTGCIAGVYVRIDLDINMKPVTEDSDSRWLRVRIDDSAWVGVYFDEKSRWKMQSRYRNWASLGVIGNEREHVWAYTYNIGKYQRWDLRHTRLQKKKFSLCPQYRSVVFLPYHFYPTYPTPATSGPGRRKCRGLRGASRGSSGRRWLSASQWAQRPKTCAPGQGRDVFKERLKKCVQQSANRLEV